MLANFRVNCLTLTVNLPQPIPVSNIQPGMVHVMTQCDQSIFRYSMLMQKQDLYHDSVCIGVCRQERQDRDGEQAAGAGALFRCVICRVPSCLSDEKHIHVKLHMLYYFFNPHEQ